MGDKGVGSSAGDLDTLRGQGWRDSPRLAGTIPEFERLQRTADGRKAQGEIAALSQRDKINGRSGCQGAASRDRSWSLVIPDLSKGLKAVCIHIHPCSDVQKRLTL